MSARDTIESTEAVADEPADGADLLRPLIHGTPPVSGPTTPIAGVLTGELVAITDEGRTPLVLYPGQPGSAALPARSVVDLQGLHIGKRLVLMFEAGDPMRPIVMGLLREGEGWPFAEPRGQVEIDADGERLVVSAKEQVVLRCGKASITLTRAGKVLIQGTYVLSRSSGVNRVQGGGVQLN